MNRRKAFLFAVLLLIVVAVACDGRLNIGMDDRVPPTFTFNGSPFAEYKRADFFIVIELARENEKLPAYSQPLAEDKTIWWIWPNSSDGGELGRLPVITYGKVPDGWHQTVPAIGPPPSLIEGRVYAAGGPQITVPRAHMRFTIRDGQAVRLPLYQDEFDKQKSNP
jgi:hypothetical protein